MAGTKGEGSRGGHIIGHTKSGAPIYGSTADKVVRGKTGSAGARSPRSLSHTVIGAATVGAYGAAGEGLAKGLIQVRSEIAFTTKHDLPRQSLAQAAETVLDTAQKHIGRGFLIGAGLGAVGYGINRAIGAYKKRSS